MNNTQSSSERQVAPCERRVAFRVDRSDFEGIFARVKERGLAYWADPSRTREGETYEFQGDRGFYVLDPNGHLLEVITEL